MKFLLKILRALVRPFIKAPDPKSKSEADVPDHHYPLH